MDMIKFRCSCCGVGANKMQPEFIKRFEILENKWGKPLNISSGYRCPKHNKEVGGVDNSAHVRGYAADIVFDNSTQIYKFVQQAISIFNRIGISSKGKSHFVHLDSCPSSPAFVLWTY